jgi:hypothetical protein
VADQDRVDTESMPLTERYTPTFDTGIHQKVEPELFEPDRPARRRRWWRRRSDATPPEAPAEVPVTDDVPAVDRYQYVKWWQFVLILLAVWVPAGAAGAGLFYWWSHDNSKHKTAVVFVVLVYIVACTVAGLILAMVPDRPLVSALAIGLISAVFAAVVGAAPAYGTFYCEHIQRPCFMGVLPH